MSHLAHPKIAIRSRSLRTRPTSTAANRTTSPASRGESLAAPLTLAAVVGGGLLLAVATALASALGA